MGTLSGTQLLAGGEVLIILALEFFVMPSFLPRELPYCDFEINDTSQLVSGSLSPSLWLTRFYRQWTQVLEPFLATNFWCGLKQA